MTRARASTRLLVRAALAGWVSAAALSAIDARADEPIAPEADTNPDRHPPPSARPNLLLIGAAVTAGWYGAAVGTSYLWSESDGASSLRIPVAGPYMALAKTGCASRETNCGTFDVVLRTIFTSLSAVGQTGGVLAMLEGAFVPVSATPTRGASTSPLEDRSRSFASAPFRPQVGVVSVGGSVGLGLFGNF